MAFFCCPEKEAKKRTQKLSDLKNLVEAIEEQMLVPCSLVCCPLCLPQNVPPENDDQECQQQNPPDVMVCYKHEKIEKKRNGRSNKRNEVKRTKRAKSRELRASIYYMGCDCEKRNGLQDDCRRTGCHGSPECLTKPDPICGPSEFSGSKHLGKKFGIGKPSYGPPFKLPVEEPATSADETKVSVYYNCYPAAVKC